MKKFLLLMCAAVTSTCSLAESLKLNCNISIEHRFSEGNIRREQVAATVDVYDQAPLRNITIRTHKIIAVASVGYPATPTTTLVSDQSSSEVWNLREESYDPSTRETSKTYIAINRNTGGISFENYFRDATGFIRTTGSGACSKIDPNIRKF